MTNPDDPLDRLASAADALAAARRRTPAATYRLQMHKGFTLRDAAAATDYLHALGVSHAYTSSLLAAKPGSTHGYDVADHDRLNPEIGTDAEFAAWAADLAAKGMGLVLDTVPNHMVVGGDNAWWVDVLENGPASPFADYFDIAWRDHPRERLHGKVLLPVLGEPYGTALDGGQFKPGFAGGAFYVELYGNRLPLDPRTYGAVLAPAVDTAKEELGAENPDVLELQSILNAVTHLPPRTEPDPARAAVGRAEAAVIKRRLGELGDRHPRAADHVRRAVAKLAGTPGDPASFTALDQLLDAQAYRPSFWRVASDEINYRRFFDINDLGALSTEREEVFAAVHRKLFEWLAAGQADGLRIDHPDGLYDPRQYLDRLQLYYRLALARKLLTDAPDDFPGLAWEQAEPALKERWSATALPSPLAGEDGESSNRVRGEADTRGAGVSPGGQPDPSPPTPLPHGERGAKWHPLYVVVEKILGPTERLPPDWACDGTTGYEFLNAVNGLFVDGRQEQAVTDEYVKFSGMGTPFEEVVSRSKLQVLQFALSSELHMLAHQLDRLAQMDRTSRDFTLNGLRHALRDVITCFPVYRSYVNGGASDTDRLVINKAVAKARRRNPLLGRRMFEFIRDTLLLKDPPGGPATDEYRAAQRRFAGKFQQVTSPVMAKGLEDTSFYVFNRLASLNEVGGEPGRFGLPPEKLHAYLAERAERTPGGLSPLATHDTKRGEDVRARLNVLSEVPQEWGRRLARWAFLNRGHKVAVEEGTAPDANEEYLLYQTLVGAWPVGGLPAGEGRLEFVRRIQEYMNKALHEAKVHTSWVNPDQEYDDAVSEFVARILDPEKSAEFLEDLAEFQGRVSHFGMFNGLSQTVLRCLAPGVPDTYQGTELWDFSLVDPDNRRPVDYACRARLLADLDARAAGDVRGLARELMAAVADGRAKLWTVSRCLRLRRERPELFAAGGYEPASAAGAKADHLFGFVRAAGGAAVLAAVPRLTAGLLERADLAPLGDVWADTTLTLPESAAGRRWVNVLTGEALTDDGGRLPATAVFADFPVAVLVSTV